MTATTDRSGTTGQTRKVWLIIELLLLYGAGPLAIALMIWTWRMPLWPILLSFMLVFLVILLADRNFSVRAMLGTAPRWPTLRAILLLLPFGAVFVFGFAYWLDPGAFMNFPRDRFRLWLAVMILYPLIAVVAQEIIYRVFFWQRYGALFEGRPGLAIVINAALFGFAHVIMRNWIAVVLSFIAGLILAWRYQRTKSFWAAVLEHGIYGDLIFTAGLGLYFYSGAVR